MLNSNTPSTCPRNMANFDPLTAEIGSGVYGTPARFNGFCVSAALLHGTLVIMAALCNTAGHYIFILFFLSSLFLFSSRNLSGRRVDVYDTCTHGVP